MLENVVNQNDAKELNSSENKARGPPRILYHGTCRNYLYQTIYFQQKYTHVVKNIHLSETPIIALGYAIKRARNDYQPILLIVDTEKLNNPLTPHGGHWVTPSINMGSYVLMENCHGLVRNARITKHLLKKIPRLESFITSSTFAEIKKRNIEKYQSYIKVCPF